LTLLAGSDAADDPYAEVNSQFSPEEIVALLLAAGAINGWNRFALGLRSPAGSYLRHHGGA
jgi:alkylhydroperoxidase family enzyme